MNSCLIPLLIVVALVAPSLALSSHRAQHRLTALDSSWVPAVLLEERVEACLTVPTGEKKPVEKKKGAEAEIVPLTLHLSGSGLPSDGREDTLPPAGNASEAICCFGYACSLPNGVCCHNSLHCCPYGTMCVPSEDPKLEPQCQDAMRAPGSGGQGSGKLEIASIKLIGSEETTDVDLKSGEESGEESSSGSSSDDGALGDPDDEGSDDEEASGSADDVSGSSDDVSSGSSEDVSSDNSDDVSSGSADDSSSASSSTTTTTPSTTTGGSSSPTTSSSTSSTSTSRDERDFGTEVKSDPGIEGAPWPPMAAFTHDGRGGTFAVTDQKNWMGLGLVRNGTYNKVSSEADCAQQCELLEECRVALFVRTDGQCWLDSEVNLNVQPCPLVDEKRNCVSYVKKLTRKDMHYPYSKTSTNLDRDWASQDQENWAATNAETVKQGGKLTRDGRYNVLDSDRECVAQCADMKYCRVAVYHRGTGECWLASKVKKQGTDCAQRGGKRDCISYLKERTDRERQPGADSMKPYVHQGTRKQGQAKDGSYWSGSSTNKDKFKHVTFQINVPRP